MQWTIKKDEFGRTWMESPTISYRVDMVSGKWVVQNKIEGQEFFHIITQCTSETEAITRMVQHICISQARCDT